MRAFIRLLPGDSFAVTGTKDVYSTGQKLEGIVNAESSWNQNISTINVHFVGRLSVEIRSRNPTLKTVNVAHQILFRQTKCLWEGSWRQAGPQKYSFDFRFPDDPSLPPSYDESESPYLAGVVAKGTVEYYLEVQFLGPNLSSPAPTRRYVGYSPHRYQERPALLPIKLPIEFTCQTPKLAFDSKKGSLKKLMRAPSSIRNSAASSKDPKVHFLLNFVHSSEAILGQTLHLFVDLSPDADRTTSLEVPPVYLKYLKIVLIADHILSTSVTGEDQNGVPTRWVYRRPSEIIRWKAADANKMILLFDKADLRPYFRGLKIPRLIQPSLEHDNLTIRYHFEISAAFDCLGETFRQEDRPSEWIKLLPAHLSPAIASDTASSLRPTESNDDWGTFSNEDECPVCRRQLPFGPESLREQHLNDCLGAATSVRVPERPQSILVVDDYNDFTSPLIVAYLSYLKRQNGIISRCIGRVVWAEHEHYDVLELPASRDQLQSLLAAHGINWTRLPNHRYWEAEELHAYDYILYAGQNIQKARLTLDNAPLAIDNPTTTTLLNMANLVPRRRWPHDSRNVETAWIRMPTPEARLNCQFEVIKDCCLELAWSLFNLALPGFSTQDHPTRAEMEAARPTELPVPTPLPPELSAIRETQELSAADSVSQRRLHRRSPSQVSNNSGNSLYNDPDQDLETKVRGMHLRPTQAQRGPVDVPNGLYEMPG